MYFQVENSIMRRTGCPVWFLAVFVLVPVNPAKAQVAKPRGERIVPAGAKLELLFTRSAAISGGLTEGPAVAPDGSIYFSDIPRGADRGMILRFDPRTKKTTVFTRDSGKSNGLLFDREGHLVACEGSDEGGRRVSRWNIETGQRTTVADRYRGKRFNAPNDLVIDRQGRIYFTDPRYLGAESRELEHRAVYRIELDGSVVEVTRDVEKPNGVTLSRDQKTLVVADHNNGTDRIDPTAPPPKKGAMKIYAFPLGPDGLVAGPRRTLVDFGDRAGCDGMTVDIKGNIYLTVRSLDGPGVKVIDRNGREVAFIPTGPAQAGAKNPVGLPSNCVFGVGVDSSVLYVTVDTSLYRIRLQIDGFHQRQTSLLEVFRDEFVEIHPGRGPLARSFRMGSESGSAAERPVREVTLHHDFSIAAYEVPQNLWEAVMGANPSRWKGPRNSVEMLSFHEAVAFCRAATRISRAAGLISARQVLRLPSEAEWEYCARAGTDTAYSFGDAIKDLGDFAWYTGNAKGNDPPVGAKKPNPWKLYDIHGYLWEWCADSWHPSYAGAPTDGSAWTAGGDASTGVLRGGSWKDKPEALTSRFRRRAPRSLRDDAVGLRCVLADGD